MEVFLPFEKALDQFVRPGGPNKGIKHAVDVSPSEPRAGQFHGSERFSRTQSWLYIWFVVLQK